MKRVRVNFLVDALALAGFLLLTSTGILLRYQLPPGSGGHQGRGDGYASAEQSVLTVWQWSRHDWGAFHFWVACALLAVLAVHLFLHWKWVVYVVKGKVNDRSGVRLGIGIFALLALLLLSFAPALAPTAESTRGELDDEIQSQIGNNEVVQQIRGSITLEDLCILTDIESSTLLKKLGLSEDVPLDAPLGPLLRSQGRHMEDLRNVVAELIDGKPAILKKQSTGRSTESTPN